MKYLSLIITALLIFQGCSSDDNTNSISNKVMGQWILIQSEQYVENSDGEMVLDTKNFEEADIQFYFRADGTLKVSGADGLDAPYSDGIYQYEFRTDYLGHPINQDEPKYEIVDIDHIIWLFENSTHKMSLDQSYVDGPTLIFEKNN